MGWHKDGHGPSEYIAHYLLGDVDEGLGWLEVALPPRAAADNDHDDGEESYTVDLGADDDAERRAISRATFLPFGLTTTAGQRLVVFEDARAMHRTPLTAHARAELQARRQRPMARVVFHGAGRQRRRRRLPGAARGAAPAAALPAGLRRAVEGYAAAAGAPSFEEALDARARRRGRLAFVAVASRVVSVSNRVINTVCNCMLARLRAQWGLAAAPSASGAAAATASSVDSAAPSSARGRAYASTSQ